MSGKSKKNKKTIGLKEVILVTLFSVLTFVVSMITAIPFAGSVLLQLYAGYALMAIISGPIYVLMISKSSKTGTQLLFMGIKALYFFLMGQVVTGVIFAVTACICEVICVNGGYHKTLQAGAAYAIHTTIYGLGSFFPVILLGDTYAQGLIDKGYAEETVNTMVSTYRNPGIVVTVILMLIVTSVIGIVIGAKLMKKQFAPAGLTEEV
ncbi:MAG: MptD family putative ECF transporter S component [Lachnospiraceae bacterium]|nr:MptD family putative ECF transporter S component [Lachnospiraceae bacterium]